jgi:hypothetical protein
MSRFRKKPVEVEAVRVPLSAKDVAGWDALIKFLETGATWSGGNYSGFVLIETLEGTMQGSAGDWIIRGVKGEFYPCKPDIFDATYEPAA